MQRNINLLSSVVMLSEEFNGLPGLFQFLNLLCTAIRENDFQLVFYQSDDLLSK